MKIEFESEELGRECAEKLEPKMQGIKADFRVPPMNKDDGCTFHYTADFSDDVLPMTQSLDALIKLGEELYIDFNRDNLREAIRQLQGLVAKLREVEEFFGEED
jgi:hypothetical protein